MRTLTKLPLANCTVQQQHGNFQLIKSRRNKWLTNPYLIRVKNIVNIRNVLLPLVLWWILQDSWESPNIHRPLLFVDENKIVVFDTAEFGASERPNKSEKKVILDAELSVLFHTVRKTFGIGDKSRQWNRREWHAVAMPNTAAFLPRWKNLPVKRAIRQIDRLLVGLSSVRDDISFFRAIRNGWVPPS